jgi:hypothetical protein
MSRRRVRHVLASEPMTRVVVWLLEMHMHGWIGRGIRSGPNKPC